MTRSVNVSNSIDGLLPSIDDVMLSAPSNLQLETTGVGMPSLRLNELGRVDRLIDYQRIKAVNPLRNICQLDEFRLHYVSLRSAALIDDQDAINDLGWLCLNGRWLPADNSLARQLFRLAASLGSAEALFNLAVQSSSKGSLRNGSLVVDYYELAYERGLSCAALALGLLYESGGAGVSVDCSLAVEWFLRGAQVGDPDACFNLGRILLDKASPKCEPATGLYWLQVAARQGHSAATGLLVDLYNSGLEISNPELGLLRFWREHAIRMGSSKICKLSINDVKFHRSFIL